MYILATDAVNSPEKLKEAIIEAALNQEKLVMHTPLQYDKKFQNAPPPAPTDWPIVKLNQAKDTFLQAISDTTTEEILSLYAHSDTFCREIAKSLLQEQERLQKIPYRVDSKTSATFWKPIISALESPNPPLNELLHEITLHYAQEIAGGFDILHYKLAQAAGCHILNKLLNPVKAKRPRKLTEIRAQLLEQIQIVGAIDELRALSQKGTIVIVPTHASHFDSVLMWWIIHTLGLPPFIYGAGLNLYNSKFFAYFMNKLGPYKVDRRKKNIVYLKTLKNYSKLALQWGCHSLFYPEGTRSRTGAIQDSLKLGLLGTALEAQRMNYACYNEHDASKIFIVPVVCNYHFVLEAPLLIRQHLSSQGEYEYTRKKAWFKHPYKLFTLIQKVATKSSNITVSIGIPMDVMGNHVDSNGNSYDLAGKPVDLQQALADMQDETDADQRLKTYTRTLGKNILASYRVNNCVLTSSLLAFTAFQLFRKQYAEYTLKDFLQLENACFTLPYEKLTKHFIKVRNGVLALADAQQIRVADELQSGTIASMIDHGISNLGIYNYHTPLLRDANGDITTRDICTLLYYHNKLTGYELEKFIQ